MGTEEADPNSMCRICMRNSQDLYTIFDEVQQDESGTNTIADIITECTKYPVACNDKLPTKICSPCMDSARNAHSFKRQTEQAYCRLKALYDITWLPKPEKGSANTSLVDRYTQTEKSTVFQCETCPQKFFAENELRQHRTISHVYDGKKCRVCGEKYNHLGQLKVHLSTEHPGEGIRCDYKCQICQREFTRKDHLKRHMINVHKIGDEQLNLSRVSLDEPEINIDNSIRVSATLNNYSNNWSDYQQVESEAPGNVTAKTSENVKATNPFSSDEGDTTDFHDLNEMDEEDIKQFVDTVSHPEISIKVESTECSENNLSEKSPTLDEEFLREPISNVGLLKSENNEECTKPLKRHRSYDGEDDCNKPAWEDEHHSETSENADDSDMDAYDEDKKVGEIHSCLTKNEEKCENKNENNANKDIKASNYIKNISLKASRRRHGSSKAEDNRCEECNRSFSRYNHLLRHMLTHSDEKPHICSFCSKGFSRSDHLQKHIQSIHCEKNFKCDQCDSAYGRKDHLLRHIETRHNKNPTAPKPQFACDMCEKKFTTKTYLARHRLLHTDRLYACKHCPETFQEKEQIKEHQKKEHSQPRNFLCSICGDSFQRNEYLKIHMRRHTGEKPYKCRFCEKGFPRSTDLKMHERYHIGLKPNLCNLCGKGFHRPYNLTIHMRTHTGEKPYKCNQCPQAFAQSNDLKAHIRRHTGERFRCDACGAAFLQRYGLNAHLRTVHGIVVTSFTGRLRKTDQYAEGGESQDDVVVTDQAAEVEDPTQSMFLGEHHANSMVTSIPTAIDTPCPLQTHSSP